MFENRLIYQQQAETPQIASEKKEEIEETIDDIWDDLESLDRRFDELSERAEDKVNKIVEKLKKLTDSLSESELNTLGAKFHAIMSQIKIINESRIIEGISGEEKKERGGYTIDYLGDSVEYMEKNQMSFIGNQITFKDGSSASFDGNTASISIMTTHNENELVVIAVDKDGSSDYLSILNGMPVKITEITPLKKEK